MKLFMGFSLIGAGMAGLAHHAEALAEASPHSAWELVQSGGTGGLIACLLAAVWALWKDRQFILSMLHDERKAHRQEITDLNATHTTEIRDATDKLLREMKDQIQQLRESQEHTA